MSKSRVVPESTAGAAKPRTTASMLAIIYSVMGSTKHNPALQFELPNLHQVLNSSVYQRMVKTQSTAVKRKAQLDHDGDITKQDADEIDEEIETYTRETLMAATNDCLVNKAFISALFLTFNIPAIMAPPLAVDMGDPSYVIFFLAAGFSIASGFFVILAGTFITTHAMAATALQSLAVEFSSMLAAQVLMVHHMFIFQGLATSTQVAAVCVGLMGVDSWALWVVCFACFVSLFAVGGVMRRIKAAWMKALEVEE